MIGIEKRPGSEDEEHEVKKKPLTAKELLKITEDPKKSIFGFLNPNLQKTGNYCRHAIGKDKKESADHYFPYNSLERSESDEEF